MVASGKTGTSDVEQPEAMPSAAGPSAARTDTAGTGEPIHCEHVHTNLEPAPKNEFGEMDGELGSDTVPHVFVNNGKAGVGLVNWAGGPGGAGQQPTGSVTLVAPRYDGAEPASPGATARAWVQPGSATATVTRSYLGVQVGANGTYYFTARACARADVHEQLHVASSQSLHNTHITPLERRVAQHTDAPKALVAGANRAAAIQALQTFINWNASIQAFQNADTAANTPGGTVDTADMASPTFIRNLGPGTVSGVAYNSIIVAAGEAAPPP